MKFAPKQILCAVDFSELSALALKYAAVAARRYGATLTVLHAEHFELPPYFTRADTDRLSKEVAEQKRAARTYLAQYARTVLGSAAAGLALDTRVVERHPVDALLEAARRNLGLMVLGTHGRGGAQRLLLGSVAENVIRQAGVPVLVARQKQHDFIDVNHPNSVPNLKRILCPVNFTAAARAALELAASIAGQFNAQLTVLHVADPKETTRAAAAFIQLCAWIPRSRATHCALEPLVRRGRPAEQILRFAVAEKQDLIVLGARPRSALRAVFLGSTAEPVLRHSPTPVLFVPQPARRT
jgi:nucleotide-binding universal stress UspA family protein